MGVTWSPFSYGPHSCIGQGLAMQELRTVLAVFLSRFKFELPGTMLYVTRPVAHASCHVLCQNRLCHVSY